MSVDGIGRLLSSSSDGSSRSLRDLDRIKDMKKCERKVGRERERPETDRDFVGEKLRRDQRLVAENPFVVEAAKDI